MKDELLSKSFNLLGLGMYEKWDAALNLLKSLEKSEAPVLLSEGVSINYICSYSSFCILFFVILFFFCNQVIGCQLWPNLLLSAIIMK